MQPDDDRQNLAFLRRMEAERACKHAFFWEALAVIALFVHVLFLAIVFLAFALFCMTASWSMDKEADALWPNPKDYGNE